MQGSTEYWFPTPIYYSEILDPLVQNKFLAAYNKFIQEDKFQGPKGWNSQLISDPSFSSNFIQDNNMEEFSRALDFHIKTYLTTLGSKAANTPYKMISSWMTLTKKGGYAHTHVHGDADISGVFYVRTNGKDGSIFFETPNKVSRNSFAFRHFQQRVTYPPSVGKLILFPGWLEHGVETNTEDYDRVSVSFNLVFERI